MGFDIVSIVAGVVIGGLAAYPVALVDLVSRRGSPPGPPVEQASGPE